MTQRLTALEIKKKEFQQKMRGADPDEVQAFLDQASLEVETLTIEKKDLQDDLAKVTDRLEHYLSLESTIEKTLAAAQQTAVKMEEQARKEAELILRDATIERERLLNEFRIEADRMQSAVLRARGEYQSTLARMRSAMTGFSSFLQSVEPEAVPVSTYATEVQSVMEYHE